MAVSKPAKTRGVLWASTNSHHNYFDSPSKKPRAATPSGSATLPKPILKRTTQTFAGTPPPLSPPRDVTPAPESPSTSTDYLAGPLKVIVNTDASIADQVEAYGKLSLRLRSMAEHITTKGRNLPALQPMLQNASGLIAALKRDISRALEDPRGGDENTPPLETKKRRGMTDDEARHARSLCTSSMAALRFSGLILSSNKLQELFSASEIDDLLTAVLSIPLAEVIPTPNCRKTYALSISILSLSTLPAEIVEKAASRMAFAFQRALQGQLGREGKKGAAADSLKVSGFFSTFGAYLIHPYLGCQGISFTAS